MRTDHWPGPVRRLLAARRRARFRFLTRHVRTWDGMRVVDLGCGRTGRSTTDFAPADWTIVGVDRLSPTLVHHDHPNFVYVRGDVSDLSAFRDGEFDLAISIGLLEHVTDPTAFRDAAREIQRVAPQFGLVVPYRYAWIEPHYLVPFFPVLPRRLQNLLVRAFDLKGHGARVRNDRDFLDRVTRWRTNAEYQAWFPGSRIRLSPTLETVLIVKSAGLRAARQGPDRSGSRRTASDHAREVAGVD